jgi:hypothetical protein
MVLGPQVGSRADALATEDQGEGGCTPTPTPGQPSSSWQTWAGWQQPPHQEVLPPPPPPPPLAPWVDRGSNQEENSSGQWNWRAEEGRGSGWGYPENPGLVLAAHGVNNNSMCWEDNWASHEEWDPVAVTGDPLHDAAWGMEWTMEDTVRPWRYHLPMPPPPHGENRGSTWHQGQT